VAPGLITTRILFTDHVHHASSGLAAATIACNCRGFGGGDLLLHSGVVFAGIGIAQGGGALVVVQAFWVFPDASSATPRLFQASL
jgi:hypothetical protein